MVVDVLMTSPHSHLTGNSFMDWEPAEDYNMDMDEKDPYMIQGLLFSPNQDVYMAATDIQVHMTSPIFISQPLHFPLPIIETDHSTFFLPPLETHIMFPPIKFPPFPRHMKTNSLGFYLPAVPTYHSESLSAISQGVTYTLAADNHDFECPVIYQNTDMIPSSVVDAGVPAYPSYQGEQPVVPSESPSSYALISVDMLPIPSPDSEYREISANASQAFYSISPRNVPVIPNQQPQVTFPSKSRSIDQDFPALPTIPDCRPKYTFKPSTSRGVSPIFMSAAICDLEPLLLDMLEDKFRACQIGDTQVAVLRTPIKSDIFAEWSDRIVDGDITPSNGNSFVESVTPPGWPGWVVNDVTSSSTQSVVVETNTPVGWPDYIVDEDTTPISQYVDSEVDLIGLYSKNSGNPNSKDDPALRAFGGSSLEDLDWILEGFRTTNIPDAYIMSKNNSNEFESTISGINFAPTLPGFSPISPYDWGLASEIGSDLISFDSSHTIDPGAAHSGSSELPSFQFEGIIQTEPNGLFHTSTPTPCDQSVFEQSPLAAPTQDNVAPYSTPDIAVISDSQSAIDYSPVSDTQDTSDVQSYSPFNPICHGNTFDFSEAAYTVERNALRNMKAFKRKLSLKVQKLQDRTKTSTGFLKFLTSPSRDIHTTRAGKRDDTDVEHDVFGKIAEVADKRTTKPTTKVDASTQTDELVGAAYNFRPPRCPRPYSRYFPYRKLGRSSTFGFGSSGSGDMDISQLIQEPHCSVISCVLPPPNLKDDVPPVSVAENTIHAPGSSEPSLPVPSPISQLIQEEPHFSVISCILPPPNLKDDVPPVCSNIQEPTISELEVESESTIHDNERELEEADQEEKHFPGAYPIELGEDFEACLLPGLSVEEPVFGFKNSLFRLVAYLFRW